MIYLPDELGWLKYPAGMEWPDGNEDELFGLAGDWQAAADELRGILDDIDAAKAASLTAYPFGKGVEEMIKDFNSMRTGDGSEDDQSLEKLAEYFDEVGKSVFDTGTEVEYTKIMFYSSLALLAFEIALCWIPPTPASPALQTAAILATRLAVRIIGQAATRALIRFGRQAFVKTVLKFLARHVAIDLTLGTMQELGTQAWQVSQGHRDQINDRQLLVTMVSSAAGGAFAGPAGELLSNRVLGPQMNRWLKAAITGPAAGFVGAEAGNYAAIGTQLAIDLHDAKNQEEWDAAWDRAQHAANPKNHDPLMLTAGVSNGLLSSLSGTGAHAFRNRGITTPGVDTMSGPSLSDQIDAIVGISPSEGRGVGEGDDSGLGTDEGSRAAADDDTGQGGPARGDDEVGVGEGSRAGLADGEGEGAGSGSRGDGVRPSGASGLGSGGNDGSSMRPAASPSTGESDGGSGSRAAAAGDDGASDAGRGEDFADTQLTGQDSRADGDRAEGDHAANGDRPAAEPSVTDRSGTEPDSPVTQDPNGAQRAGVLAGESGLSGADLGARGLADSSAPVTAETHGGATHTPVAAAAPLAAPLAAHAPVGSPAPAAVGNPAPASVGSPAPATNTAPAAAGNPAPASQAAASGETRGAPASSAVRGPAVDLRQAVGPDSPSGAGIVGSTPDSAPVTDESSSADRSGAPDDAAAVAATPDSRAGLADTGRAGADNQPAVRADHADNVATSSRNGVDTGETRLASPVDDAVAPVVPLTPGENAPSNPVRRRARVPIGEPGVAPTDGADRGGAADRNNGADGGIAGSTPDYAAFLPNGQGVVHAPTATSIGNDTATHNVRNNVRNEGAHDVVLHGSRAGQPIPGLAGPVDPALIAQAILNNPHYVPGTPVRLLSCHSGADGSFARTLADLLGARVEAPTDEVRVRQDSDQPAELPAGKWETFDGRNGAEPTADGAREPADSSHQPADSTRSPRDFGDLDMDRMGEDGRSRAELEAALGGPLRDFADPGAGRPRHQGIVDELMRMARDADPGDIARGAGPRAFVVDQFVSPGQGLIVGGAPYAMVVGLDPATGQHRVEILDPETGARHPYPRPTPPDLRTVSAVLMDSQGNVVEPRVVDPRLQFAANRGDAGPAPRVGDLTPDPRNPVESPARQPDPRSPAESPARQPDPRNPAESPAPQSDSRRPAEPRFYDPDEAYEAGRNPDLPRDAPFGPAVDGSLANNSPDVSGPPRSLDELRRDRPDLSFDDLLDLREALYQQAGIEPPSLSRESLDSFLDAVWADRDAMPGAMDVYNLYALQHEPNVVTDPAGYLRAVTDILVNNPELQYAMIQSPHGRGMVLPETVGDVDPDFHFLHFNRPGADFSPGYRVYVNPRMDAAPELMRNMVRDLLLDADDFTGVKTAKVAGPLATRPDAIVVYVRDIDDAHRVTEWLRDYRDRAGDVFVWDAPPMARQMLEGVGIGAHPKGNSFGFVRSVAIRAALEATLANGGDFADFHAEVLRRLPEAGVSPDNPHQRPESDRPGYDRMGEDEPGDDTPAQKADRVRAELADLRADLAANRAEFLHGIADAIAESDPIARDGESAESARGRARQADWNARQLRADADLLWSAAGDRPETPTPTPTPDPRVGWMVNDAASQVESPPIDPRRVWMLDDAASQADPSRVDPRRAWMLDDPASQSNSAPVDPRRAWMLDDSASQSNSAPVDPRRAWMLDDAASQADRSRVDPRRAWMMNDPANPSTPDPRADWMMDPAASQPDLTAADAWAKAEYDRLMAERNQLARETQFWRAKRDDRVTRLMGIVDAEQAVGTRADLAQTMRRLADEAASRPTRVAPIGEEAGGQVNERRSQADQAHRREAAAKLDDAARRVIELREDLAAIDRQIAELEASGALDGRPPSAEAGPELDRLARQRAAELLRIKPHRAMRDDLAQRFDLVDADGAIDESALAPENLAATIDQLRDNHPASRTAELDALATAARDVNEAHNRIGRLQDEMALVAGAARTDVEGDGGRMHTRDVGLIDGEPPRIVVYGPRDPLGYLPRDGGLTDHETALQRALSTSDAVVRAFTRDRATVEFRRITADREGNARVDAMPNDGPQVRRTTIDYTIRDSAGGRTHLDVVQWRSSDGTWHDVNPEGARWENRRGSDERPDHFEGRPLPEGVSSVGVSPTQAAIVDGISGSHGPGINEGFLPRVPGGPPLDPGLDSHANPVPEAASNLLRITVELVKISGWSWFQDPNDSSRIKPGFKPKRLIRRFSSDQQPFVNRPDRADVVAHPNDSAQMRDRRDARRAAWAEVQRWADQQYDQFLRTDGDVGPIADAVRDQRLADQRTQARDMVDAIKSALDDAAARLPGDPETRKRALIDEVRARLADPETRFSRKDTEAETRREALRQVYDWLESGVPNHVIADTIANQLPSRIPELTLDNVRQIKQFLMEHEILMTDPDSGQLRWRPLDRLAHVAEAWGRLSRGEPEPGDLLLMRDAWEWSEQRRRSYEDDDYNLTWEEIQDRVARMPGDHWDGHRAPLTGDRANIPFEAPARSTPDDPTPTPQGTRPEIGAPDPNTPPGQGRYDVMGEDGPDAHTDSYRDPDGTWHHSDDAPNTHRDANFGYRDASNQFLSDHLTAQEYEYLAQKGDTHPYEVSDPDLARQLRDASAERMELQAERDAVRDTVDRLKSEFGIERLTDLTTERLGPETQRQQARLYADPSLTEADLVGKLATLADLEVAATKYNDLGPKMVEVSKHLGELAGRAFALDPQTRPGAVLLSPFDGSFDGANTVDIASMTRSVDGAPTTLIVVEAKGVGASLGGSKTAHAQQGSPEYLRRTLAIDQNLARILNETPAQMAARGLEPDSDAGRTLSEAVRELRAAAADGTLRVEYHLVHASARGEVTVTELLLVRDGVDVLADVPLPIAEFDTMGSPRSTAPATSVAPIPTCRCRAMGNRTVGCCTHPIPRRPGSEICSRATTSVAKRWPPSMPSTRACVSGRSTTTRRTRSTAGRWTWSSVPKAATASGRPTRWCAPRASPMRCSAAASR